ncbi:MAG: hypothetical protein ACREA0_26885, partial [bacterium]
MDIIFDRCRLSADRLYLTLHAHPQFDVGQVHLAVRALPGEGLHGRRQVADHIVWHGVQEERREGVAEVELPKADSALTMLMIGADTVRRQWFVDPARAANHRLLAVQQFDKELRMIRQALFKSTDASRFETAVAALLFLLGLAPMVQLETDSPDLIVATPRGRLAIIECTTCVADIASKIGKLVDRRGALDKMLQAGSYATEVAAVLVCRLPKDQIAAHADTMRSHRTIIVAAEELAEGLDRVRFPFDPDLMLDQAQQ